MSEPIAVRLFDAGFTQLVSVIPPGATLSPSSRIPVGQLGKIPGRQNSGGTWGGYHWLEHTPTREEVQAWAAQGANLGLRADRHPSLDIDTPDEHLAAEVEELALQILGPAPVRFGRRPKRLLMYRTDLPFSRMAVIITRNGVEHLIEFLGALRQYLIEGTHPSGSRYEWFVGRDHRPLDLSRLNPGSLTAVTREQVAEFLDTLAELYGGVRVGDGAPRTARVVQDQLVAPSLEALEAAVAALPNTAERVPGRAEYIQIGEAIHAACGEDEEGGYAIFAAWAERHEREEHKGTPEDWREDWRRFHAPHAIGWGWLADMAGQYGFNRAAWEMPAEPAEVAPDVDQTPPMLSDAWLADQVVLEAGHLLRYVPALKRWYCWDGTRWAADALQLVDYHLDRVLRRISASLLRQGATEKERKENRTEAERLASRHVHESVRTMVAFDRRIAALTTTFDADPWLLNTPGGIVDLRSGELTPPNPNAMCSRQTRVTPRFGAPAPVWAAFLEYATHGDTELEAYLRRLMGYALTGLPNVEQILAFVHGPTGTGKGTFLNAIAAIFGDYWQQAAMETFTATRWDRHPAELANLAGARLVTASETEEGRSWNDQRVKSLTGRDPISARFMYGNFFHFLPQFLLLFAGNYRPQLQSLDDAMKRRIHLVPFEHAPASRDSTLPDRLEAEYPMILAWMIRGCLEWQQERAAHPEDGLRPPAVVREATEAYFADEDPTSRWIQDRLLRVAGHGHTLRELFQSWRGWAIESGEHERDQRWLSQQLRANGYPPWRGNRGRGYQGLQIIADDIQELL